MPITIFGPSPDQQGVAWLPTQKSIYSLVQKIKFNLLPVDVSVAAFQTNIQGNLSFQQLIVNECFFMKVALWLDSNPGPLALEATAQPTLPQLFSSFFQPFFVIINVTDRKTLVSTSLKCSDLQAGEGFSLIV